MSLLNIMLARKSVEEAQTEEDIRRHSKQTAYKQQKIDTLQPQLSKTPCLGPRIMHMLISSLHCPNSQLSHVFVWSWLFWIIEVAL